MTYPEQNPLVRRSLARNDVCPECGGALDTGFECNSCGYDAQDEAYPPHMRKLWRKYDEDEVDKRWKKKGWLS